MNAELVPLADARALAAIDEARRLIAEARAAGDADTLRDWRDKAAAVQHYARTRDDAAALAADAGEIKVRAEAALGRIDAEVHPHGGDHQAWDAQAWAPDVATDTRAAWRRLGRLDDDQLDEVVSTLRADESGGVTTAAAARLARKLYEPNHAPNDERARRRHARDTFGVKVRELREALRWLHANADRVSAIAVPGELDRWTGQIEEAIEHLGVVVGALRKGGTDV